MFNKIHYASHEEWLKLRKKGLTGTDMVAICGHSKFKNAYDVYRDKISDSIIKEETENNYYLKLGPHFEALIVKLFNIEPYDVWPRFSFSDPLDFVVQHSTNSLALGSIDRFINKEEIILECKSTSKTITKDTIPYSYILQCQWYLYVTGLSEAWLAILSLGHPWNFFWVTIERSERTINSLIEIANIFWNESVLKREFTFDMAGITSYQLNDIPVKNDSETLVLEKDAYELFSLYTQTKEKIKEYTQIKQECEINLKQKIKDYTHASFINHPEAFISWKPSIRTTFDIKLFKTEHPDLYEKYLKSTHTRIFRCKEEAE